MTQGAAGVAERDTSDLRRMMVDGQIRTFDVTDQRLLECFYRTPREIGLPGNLAGLAYSDAPLSLPIAEGGQESRILLPPMILGKLLQGATLAPGQRVLVVAGATGYAAAIIAPLVARVVSLESSAALSATATDYVAGLGLAATVTLATGPLDKGYPADAPYDRIIIAGAVESGFDGLFGQLADGGALLALEQKGVRGGRRIGKAVRYDKLAGGVSCRSLFDAAAPTLAAFREPARFVF